MPDPANSGGFLVRLTDKGLARANNGMDGLVDHSQGGFGSGSMTREERHMFRILCEKFLLDLESRYFSE